MSVNKNILKLAIPNIISNITVPLLSLVDMSIVGHLSKEVYIGAIAAGTTIFNFLYWGFSFLRMGTSGFTAQACGAKDVTEEATILLRSLFIAFLGSSLLILFQKPIFELAFYLLGSSDEVKLYSAQYFNIYIWAAPAILGMYTFSGWYTGMQDARTPMYVAIFINVVNIGLNLFFVHVLHMEIKGVALGSVIAQFLGLLVTFFIWYFKYKNIRVQINFSKLKDFPAYLPFFKVNSNIFIRTLLLISVSTFFTVVSARKGDLILAANALLMQMFVLFSYIMDGFAYSAEALTGKIIGAKQVKQKLDKLIQHLFVFGISFVILFTCIYALFTDEILGILTDKDSVIDICKQYQVWVLLIPIAGFSAFLWDGVFVGATASSQMRNSMFVAVFVFFSIYYLFEYKLGNNALWLAFISYLGVRGLVQTYMYLSIRKKHLSRESLELKK